MAMPIVKSERWPVRSGEDIVRVRQIVRRWAVELGFGLVDQTKIVTAASEIARNTVDHGGGGEVLVESLSENARRGLRLVFEDKGPGIKNIDEALKDGFTTSRGLGLGLGGARRLATEFSVESRPGEGTRVSLTRWK